MKNRKDTSRLTVEIYDEDGVLCESVGGGYTFDELRDMLEDIVKNDGIPVIRLCGKHEKVEDRAEDEKKPDDMPFALSALKKAIKDWGSAEKPRIETMPMVLEYEFDGIKFHAAGHPQDVHAANEALLKRVFEEES